MHKQIILLVSILLMGILPSKAGGNGLDAWFKETDAFLQKYVEDGLVRYQAIRQNSSELLQLIRSIENVELPKHSMSAQKAFWINAYNLTVINSVLANYPISSPLDVDGFFNDKTHKIAGKRLTLDQIEKQKLMKQFGDERVHFVLVCAAKGCPPIIEGAYMPKNVEQQLQQQTEQALNSEEFVPVEHDQETVKLSKIFKWYEKDFLQDHSSIVNYINDHRREAIPSDYKTTYYKYDWSLNAKKK